jgi:hypothetical protein
VPASVHAAGDDGAAAGGGGGGACATALGAATAISVAVARPART